jgi:hypothetical protein
MGSVEAEGVYKLMAQHHDQNQGDIRTLKDGQTKLTETVTTLSGEMTTLVGEISGGLKVLKFFAWVIGTVLVGLGVWFASLEVRGKVALAAPLGVSSVQPMPQTAHLPPL